MKRSMERRDAVCIGQPRPLVHRNVLRLDPRFRVSLVCERIRVTGCIPVVRDTAMFSRLSCTIIGSLLGSPGLAMTDQGYVRVVPRPAPIEAVSSPRTAPDGRTLGEAQRVFLAIPSREIDWLVRLAASPAAGLSNHRGPRPDCLRSQAPRPGRLARRAERDNRSRVVARRRSAASHSGRPRRSLVA